METKLNEARVIILGNGNVGKTSLVRALIDHSYFPTESTITRGIEVNKWVFEVEKTEYKISFWDFGGQEIYHATHQFFLAKNSLYLIVWTARTDDDLRYFDYWLNTIKIFGHNSPVLIIQNKIDEFTKSIDKKALQNKFENIIGFHEISIKANIGLSELRKDIQDKILELPHIGQLIPQKWNSIKSELGYFEQNYISFQEFEGLCKSHNITDDNVSLLASFFHNLGFLLHFSETPILQDLIILNSNWLTSCIYQLIDSREIQKSKGRFDYKILERLWSENPPDIRAKLIEIMKQFDICFQISNQLEFIIPSLLPSEKPKLETIWESSIEFEYHYEFMPLGIISRLIVRNHSLIFNDLYWRNGLVLEKGNTKCLVESYPFRRTIRIRVVGENKKKLLGNIRKELDDINGSFHSLDVKKFVKCNECVKH